MVVLTSVRTHWAHTLAAAALDTLWILMDDRAVVRAHIQLISYVGVIIIINSATKKNHSVAQTNL